MDLHKPKPWHGVREFLKEYLIIVVGVLTALAFEAVVEQLRWAERTRQTEEHLRQKVHGITISVAGRQAVQPCIDEMLGKLQAALETGGDDWRPPFVIVGGAGGRGKGVITAPKGNWAAEDWNAAIADGTANHLPKDVLLRYSGFFETTALMKSFNEQEREDMAELNSLASIHRLDPATRAQYLRLLYRVRENNRAIVIQGQVLVNGARRMSVKLGTAGDYTRAAMAYYQEVCRQFRGGQREITATPLELVAVRP